MLKRFRDIENEFQYSRKFMLIVLLVCFFLSGFIIYKCFSAMRLAEARIYILSDGKVMEALAAGRKENIPVEARDHIRVFHQCFFALDPDEKVIREHLGRAFYLADGSARRIYEDLKESGFYAHLIAGNISQEITVDSISLNLDSYPYHFRCHATELIIRATSITTRDLVTEGQLRSISRSDNNAHGFLIEKLEILQNNDLKTQNR